jgi:hypothetical protein
LTTPKPNKLEKEAREYCAMFLMREARRQAGLALKFRRKKLEKAAYLCEMCSWAHHLSAAFLLAASSSAFCPTGPVPRS